MNLIIRQGSPTDKGCLQTHAASFTDKRFPETIEVTSVELRMGCWLSMSQLCAYNFMNNRYICEPHGIGPSVNREE